MPDITKLYLYYKFVGLWPLTSTQISKNGFEIGIFAFE